MNAFRDIIQATLESPPLTALANRVLPSWVTVFMVHRIAVPELGVRGISQDYLRDCLRYLQKQNFEFISIDDAIIRALQGRLEPKKYVAFSLDDGFFEQVAIGTKIFAEFDCPATCFLITDFIDGKFWPWDYQLMHIVRHTSPKTVSIDLAGKKHQLDFGLPSSEAYLLKFLRQVAPHAAYEAVGTIAEAVQLEMPMAPPCDVQPTTWDDVRKAERLGMRFGPHTTSHRILSSLDNAALKAEMSASAARINAECRNPSQVFCYPSGKAEEFDLRAIQIAEELGFLGALSAEPGFLDTRHIQRYANYRYVIPRLPLPDDFLEFKRYVSWSQRVREYFSESKLKKFIC